MNTYWILFYLYILCILLASIISLFRYNKIDKAAGILSILLAFTFISEGFAHFMARYYRHNLFVYHFFNPIQFFLIALYFNESVDVLRQRKIGLYIGIGGFIVAALNTICLQPLNTFNSYYLLFESIMIIGLCLFSFLRMLMKEEPIRLFSYPHFWFCTFLVFFWSLTFLSWGLYDFIRNYFYEHLSIVNKVLLMVNLITYAGFGAVFLFTKNRETT